MGKFSLNALKLQFAEPSTETAYRDFIVTHTRTFCRIAWGLILGLNLSFAFLDRIMFSQHSVEVMTARGLLSAAAGLFLGLSFLKPFRQVIRYSSGLFILFVGLFCQVLMVFSEPQGFSFYFLGLFFAFAGIFSTVGLGFWGALGAMVGNFGVFMVLFGAVKPLPDSLVLVYGFFLSGIILVFSYAGFVVERMSRRNFLANQELQATLENVRQLTGLLPICASCKKIRDDSGYWNQVETYLCQHTNVNFTHSVCPECAKKLYSELD